MTKKWKTVERKVKIFDTLTCDMCSKTAKKDNWSTASYDVAETEIQIKEGVSYPEGGYGFEVNIDLCIDCFKNKLIPWLKSQGVPCTIEKWDW